MPGRSRIRRPSSRSSCATSETDRRLRCATASSSSRSERLRRMVVSTLLSRTTLDFGRARFIGVSYDESPTGASAARPRYHPRMPPPRSLLLDRFKRLPRRSSDVWQGGVVRARTWIEEADGSVQRPWAAVWVSLGTGMMNVELAESAGAADADFALQVLIGLGLKFIHSRPARLEVVDATLGAQLAQALADPELAVGTRAGL